MRLAFAFSGRLLLCALLCSASSIAQTAAPPAPAYEFDPFCAVALQAVPWDVASNTPSKDAVATGIAIVLFSQSAPTLAAHVTLIGETDAYDAFLQRVSLSGKPPGLVSHTLLVVLPKAVAIRYAFVDSFTPAGTAATSCPSEPIQVQTAQASGWFPLTPQLANANRFTASLLQALPALQCPKAFEYPSVLGASQPAVERVDRPRTSEIMTFVNSHGDVVKTYVWQSSGLDYLDSAASLAAQRSRFAPAALLCTPVVGRYLFRVDFKP